MPPPKGSLTSLSTQVKRLFKDTAIYSIGGILPRMAGIVLAPIYTTFLTTADYGIYSLANMLSSMVGVLMLLGQDGSLTLFYRAERNEGQDPRELLFSVVLFTEIFSTILLGVLLLLGPIYTPLLSKDNSFTFVPFMIIALFTAWTTIPLSLQMAVNRAKGEAKIHTIFQVSQFAINTAFTLLFIVWLRQGAYGTLKGTFLGGALVAPFSIYLLIKEWKPKFSREALKRSLKFGLPLIPHNFLGGFVLTFADRLMLARLATMAQVGLYSYAYNLSMALNLVSQSINRAWGPIYYDLAGHDEGRAQLPRLTTIFAAVVTYAALGFTMLMPDVAILISAPKFWPAVSIIPILVGGYFFYAMYMVTSTPIFFAKKTTWIPWLTGGCAVLNVVINLFAIPAIGIAGAAWATFIAYLLMAAGARWLSSKVDGIFDDRRLITVVGIYFIGFGATYGIQMLTHPGANGRLGVLPDIGLKLIALAVLAGLFVLLRVVTPDELRAFAARLRKRREARKPVPVTEAEASVLEEREREDISAASDTTGFNFDDER